MASWREVEAEAPDLAARARAIFDAHKHKTMATLRRDGSPRISGTEIDFDDGEVWFGSMPGAVKARDLQRDAGRDPQRPRGPEDEGRRREARGHG